MNCNKKSELKRIFFLIIILFLATIFLAGADNFTNFPNITNPAQPEQPIPITPIINETNISQPQPIPSPAPPIPPEPECYTDEDCDDNNNFTLDFCIEGNCSHVEIECLVDENCDDENETTLDYCLDNSCIYELNGTNETMILFAEENVSLQDNPDATALTACGDLSADTIYNLTQNVEGATTCFNITGDNIELDCASYIINYSDSAVGYGINNSNGYDNVTIKNCIIKETTSGTNYAYGIYYKGAEEGIIENNTITTKSYAGHGIRVDVSSHGNDIANNTITIPGSNAYGIYVYFKSMNNSLINNIISTSNTNGFGIYLNDNVNNTIIDNNTITTTGTTGYGIYHVSSINSTLTNNKVNTSHTQSYVIYSPSALQEYYNQSIDMSNLAEGLPVIYNFSLSNINLYNNQDLITTYGQLICAFCDNITYNNINMSNDGINLFLTSNSHVYNSNITTSKGYGVWLLSSTKYNNISNNTISTDGYTFYGIYLLTNCDYNTIFNNNISGTGIGIYLINARPNYIINNTINNENRAIASTGGTGCVYDGNIITSVSDGYYFYNSPSIIRNSNVLVSGNGKHGIYFYDSSDTIVEDSVINSSYAGTSDIYSRGSSNNNNLTNCTFSDVGFLAGTSGMLNVHHYLDAQVNYTNGQAIQDAQVLAYNASGTFIFNETTGKGGTQEGLVSWWEFEDATGSTASDSIGSNDGTITEATWTKGKLGGGLEFDGVDDYVIKDNFDQSIYTDKVTVEMWVKRKSSGSEKNMLSSRVILGSATGFSLYHSTTTYKIIVKDDGAWGTCYKSISTGFSSDLNNWVHLTMIYNGDNITLYRNGISIGVDDCTGGNIEFVAGADYTIGTLATEFYNGTIDEVKIYNRALSPEEISENYQNSRIKRQIVLEYMQNSTNKYFHTNYTINATYSSDWSNATEQVNITTNFIDSSLIQLWIDDDAIPPNCSILSITPSDIESNSTGNFIVLINCSDDSEINESTFIITRTVEGGKHTDKNIWSARPPPNNKGAKDVAYDIPHILLADGRGDNKWYDNYNVSGVRLFQDNYTYTVQGNDSVYVNITNGTDWSMLNFTWKVEPGAFRSSVPLSRGKMEKEAKKAQAIYRDNYVLVKMWNLESYRGETNYSIAYFENFNYTSTPNTDLKSYYCNYSYVINGGVSPIQDTANCSLLASKDGTDIDNVYYSSRNSDYTVGYFPVNNSKVAGIDVTNISYIFYSSLVPAVKSYNIRYADGSSGTNVSFTNSKTAWTSTDAGVTWVQASWTPDVWHSGINDGDVFEVGVYVEDMKGNNYTNFSLYKDTIGLGDFPISNPSIEFYQSSSDIDYELNETHNGTMIIRIAVARDPNEEDTVKHSLYLYNDDETLNYTINASFYSVDNKNMNISFNTYLVPNGEYKINVSAVADDDSTDVQTYLTSENFTISNCGCDNGTYYYRCGETVQASCTLTCDLDISGTCFTIGASDIEVDGADYNIDGEDTASTYGIYIENYSNITLKNLDISHFIGGIYSINNDTIIMLDNNISHNTYGILLNNSEDFIIDNCNLTNNTIEINIEDVENGTMKNVEDGPPGDYTTGEFVYGLRIIDSSNIEMYNITLKNKKGGDVAISGASQYNTGGNAYGIYLYNVDNCTFNNITITNMSGGIATLGATNTDGSGYGIYSDNWGKRHSFVNITIKDVDYGLYVRDLTNSTLESFKINNSRIQAIHLDQQSNSQGTENNTFKEFEVKESNTSLFFDKSYNNLFINGQFINISVTDISINEEAANNTFLNVSFNSSAVTFSTCLLGCTMYFKWYVDTYVNYSNSSNASNANAKFFDNNETLQYQDITESNGMISRQNVTEYYQNSTSKYFLINYSVNATKGKYISETEQVNLITNAIDNNKIVLTLDTDVPNVALISPATGSSLTTATVTLICNSNDDGGLSNVTLIVWNSAGVNVSEQNTTVSGTVNLTSFSYTLPAEGTYTWNCRAIDTSNNNGTAESNFSLTYTIPSGGGPGGEAPGGGGGAGGVGGPLILGSFELDPKEFIIGLDENQELTEEFDITNTGEIYIFARTSISGEITDYISINSEDALNTMRGLTLDETKTVRIHIKTKEAGIYVGTITVKAGGISKNLLVTIGVGTAMSMFDAKVTIPNEYKSLEQGDFLKAEINLLRIGKTIQQDVTVTYLIKDSLGNIVLEQSETFAVSDQKSYTKEFDTTELKNGNYVLGIELRYQDQIAVSSDSFKIGEPFITKLPFSTIKYIIIIVFIISGILVLVTIIKVISRMRKSKKMRF